MIKIFNASQIRDADSYTISHEPIHSIDLMERAAEKIVEELINLYKEKVPFAIFCGSGNNGGDGLAVARLLSLKDYKVEVYFAKISNRFSDDFSINLDRLKQIKTLNISEISDKVQLPAFNKNTVLIDALFGSGLTRPLTGFSAEIVNYLNNLHCDIISIDIPSGLFGEENSSQQNAIVKAKYTLTFEFPYLSFFFPENEEYVGTFKVLPIGIHPDYVNNTQCNRFFIQQEDIIKYYKVRKNFSHKGQFGHALLLAGNYGTAGANILAARGCLRSGIGLLTCHVPKCNVQILQMSVPEALLSVDDEQFVISNLPEFAKFNIAAIGPGIGFDEKTEIAVKTLITHFKKPIIFDADAITILGKNKNWLDLISENSVFTPHIKEFERLAGPSENNFRRNERQIKFSVKYKCFVVLKGAYTAITTPDGKCFFNSTGNPGMAKGGSGDVLTGILLALSAQGYPIEDAVIMAVYLHGLAGDIAAEKFGQTAMTSGDIVSGIADAFRKIESNKL
jgi:NAD(P)H-hydrate epimerase